MTEHEETALKADIALKNRLYVSGWMLSHQLKSSRNNPSNYHIEMVHEEGIPVGVLLYSRFSDTIEIFVRKSKRNRGHGRKLITNFMNRKLTQSPKYGEGVSGSGIFYQKCLKG